MFVVENCFIEVWTKYCRTAEKKGDPREGFLENVTFNLHAEGQK